MGEITPPEPITTAHNVESFACGVPVLDEWLKRRALKNESSGASRTFVVCSEDAKQFYLRNGFLESPLDPMTLIISLQDAAHNFAIAE